MEWSVDEGEDLGHRIILGIYNWIEQLPLSRIDDVEEFPGLLNTYCGPHTRTIKDAVRNWLGRNERRISRR